MFNYNILALSRPEAAPKRPAVPLLYGSRWEDNFKVDLKN
jgi:hypothetical protein